MYVCVDTVHVGTFDALVLMVSMVYCRALLQMAEVRPRLEVFAAEMFAGFRVPISGPRASCPCGLMLDGQRKSMRDAWGWTAGTTARYEMRPG